MSDEGKASAGFMRDVVYASLGKKSPGLIVGPRKGADNAVLSLGGNRVMLLTVDPVSMIPSFGTRLSAWLSVHLIASDYTTSGLGPEYATFSFNFPPAMDAGAREEYVRSVGGECENLGVAVAAGHTGSYPGGGYTVIGAGSMFGFAKAGDYIDTSMAGLGDTILMTKAAGIEAAASLAISFPKYVEKKVGVAAASRARRMVGLCSTVEDAFTAAKAGVGAGGVTSMHDATEGGVLGGLDEMASASRRAFVVDKAKISLSEEAAEVCGAFGIDPLTSVSEGALLLTCARGAAGEVQRRLRRSGIPVGEIGKVRDGSGLWVGSGGARPRRFRPSRDRYWKAYSRAIEAGLD